MESSNNTSSPIAHRYNTRFKNKITRKSYKETDSDFSDNDFIENENEDPAFDIYKYRKLLTDLFPSQHMNDKISSMDNLKKLILSKKNRSKLGIDETPTTNIIIYQPNNKNVNKDNNLNSDEDTADSSDEDDEDESDEEDEEDDDEEDDDEEDDEDDEDDDEYDIVQSKRLKKSHSKNDLFNLTQKLIAKENSKKIIGELVKMANSSKTNSKITKKQKLMGKKKELAKKESLKRKIRVKNSKEFKQLLLEKDNLNDLKYFKEKVEIDNQKLLIRELKQINEVSTIDKPYRIIVLESDIPQVFKVAVLKKISMLENMDPSVGEYFKLKNWIDTFMRIPFNKFNTLSFNIKDGNDKCNEYMENSVDILNKAVFGLNDAKMQIMQLVAQWIVNPAAVGTAVAIKGPMGTGKTTIVKDGISKILNRPFALIALGGATDSSTLEGHGYTYEGSTWGKIVDILIQTKCSNPIFYFDELDKISDTPKGEEIIGILTHLIDATQNANYHDKYFSEIDFDLSKALFIFSYNDESKVNPILLDRMYKISTKGYDLNEKKIIANDYLLPAINKQVLFEKENVIISDETLSYIIENYTEKEAGVRNLKRCLEIIYTKIN